MRQSNQGNYIIGVDIGGTKIAVGLVTQNAQIVTQTVRATPNTLDINVVMDHIFSSIEDTLLKANVDKSRISGIGVATPGPLDPKAGILFRAPNIPAFHNTPILSLIESRFEIPTLVENDANAAGFAEAIFGAGVGYEFVLYVTVSTGIGTGIIINRKIFHGKHGSAGEGGHVTIDYQGRVCACGQHGCIEAYASGTSLTHRTRERLILGGTTSRIIELVNGNLEQVTPVIVSRAAKEGDELALALVRETGEYLAIWLGGIVNLLDPEVIIIGGGVASIGDLLINVIRNEIPNHTLNPYIDDIRIVPACLHNDVGILGAAALHMHPR